MGPRLLHPLVSQLERAKGGNYKAESFARCNAIIGQRPNRKKITIENKERFKFGLENNKAEEKNPCEEVFHYLKPEGMDTPGWSLVEGAEARETLTRRKCLAPTLAHEG